MSSILAPSNEWLQMLVGERVLMIPESNTTAAATSSGTATSALSNSARAMERLPPPPTQDHQQQLQQPAGPLKCPRCDSSNTKFCYYNNYSLSQPRHFCKACKRYWTRGGTLRSVPVGGGCRKNKRVKKPSSASAAASTPSDTPSLGPPPPRQPLSLPIPSQIDISSPMFYPLPSDMRDLNFPAIRGRVDPPSFTCTLQNGNLYDLQPQLSGLGLGFSPNHHYSGDEYHSGFGGASLSHLQQSAAVSSAAPLLHDYPLFGSSLPDSSIKQPKKHGDYRDLLPYEEELVASAEGNPGMVKQVKMEGEYNAAGSINRIDWQLPCENPSQPMTTAAAVADSSFLYWNAAGWPDTSYESSVAPLI